MEYVLLKHISSLFYVRWLLSFFVLTGWFFFIELVIYTFIICIALISDCPSNDTKWGRRKQPIIMELYNSLMEKTVKKSKKRLKNGKKNGFEWNDSKQTIS